MSEATNHTNEKPMLSAAQVAERLGVPRQRVLVAIRTGDLASVNLGRPGGRPYYRISEADLQAWLDRRRRPAR